MKARDTRERTRRAIQDFGLGLLIFLMVFGLAAWESRARAGWNEGRMLGGYELLISARLGHATLAPIPTTTPAIAISGEELLPGKAIHRVEPSEIVQSFASDRDLLWRYSENGSDHLPWFAVGPQKRLSVPSGPAQLMVMAVIFASMTALTLGLWRQLNGLVKIRGGRARHPNRSVYRLR